MTNELMDKVMTDMELDNVSGGATDARTGQRDYSGEISHEPWDRKRRPYPLLWGSPGGQAGRDQGQSGQGI